MTIGFAFENELGHRTHAQNLKHALTSRRDIDPYWVLLSFLTPGAWAKLPGVRSNWTLRSSLGAYLGLRRRLPDIGAAMFHTQVVSLLSTGLMRRVPSVISLDATPVQIDALGHVYNHTSSPGSRTEAIKRRLNIRAFHSARRLVTWSGWTKASLVDDYGIDEKRVVVIPPAVDTERWHFPGRTESGNPTRFLFVGGDFKRKGGDTLLEAFRRMKAKSAELHIVSSSHDIPEEVPNVILHRGLTPNSPALLKLYADADAFVFPTRGDCLPLAVLEALASGIPAISTDVGAIPEAVVDGETGLIVPKDDPAALASAMDLLAGDSRLRLRMGRGARDHALVHYDAAKNYARLIGLLVEIAR